MFVTIAMLFLVGCNIVAYGAEMAAAILHGEKEITIKSKSQGEITALNIDEGGAVKVGAVLAIIDDRQEEVERNLAKLEYEAAYKDYQKNKNLKKYISQDELIEKNNNTMRKKAALELKEYNLSNTRVVSPIDGVVTKKYFDKGESVSVGDKVFEVVQVDSLILDVNIPSNIVASLKIGAEVNFKTELHKDRKFKGTVQYISPVIDPSSGTEKIRLTVKNTVQADKSYLLKPGTLVTVWLE